MTLLFGPVGGRAPAAPLAAPQVLAKPDIAATDGCAGPPSSAPRRQRVQVLRHLGGGPARGRGRARCSTTPPTARSRSTRCERRRWSTASPVGSFGVDAAGAGLINAAAAVGANPPQPPLTTITKRPKNKTTKRKVTYRFTSNAPEATFRCKVDKRRYRPCASPAKVKRLDFGNHKFTVKAVANGLSGPAAKDKFKRRR